MTVAAFDPDFDRCGIKNFTDRLIAQEQAACSATVRGG
jgi:phosphomannomutase